METLKAIATLLKKETQMEHKPGYKTTEFWMTLAAMTLTQLVASGAIPTGSPTQSYITEALLILGALGYHAGRVITKSAASPAVDPLTGRESK